MESQDDSLDIVKLQRVALGLDAAPSQIPAKIPEPVSVLSPGNTEGENPPPLQKNMPPPGQEVLPTSPSIRPTSLSSHMTSRERNTSHSTEAHGSSSEQARQAHPAPSQNAKMGSAEAPSDTQVISQSVYDDMIRQNKEAATMIGLESNLGDHASLATVHEGESGHIDLFAGFDGTNTDETNADDNENEDQSSSKLGESSPMHFQPNLFPESQRFLAKTPATTVKRRRSDGPATGTPSVSRNPLTSGLESSGGIMALSQVFKATQAPSSPLVNGRQSEPISDRPSPNLPVQTSAVGITLSSPLNHIAATFPQDSSEPQLNYISTKDSQAQRDKMLRDRRTRSAEDIYSEEQSDGEFDKESSFVGRMRRQRTINEEATAQFAGVTAPARPSSRRSRQENRTRTSSGGEYERQELSEMPAPADPQNDVHGVAAGQQTGATSEEETEQEEDLDQPVNRSQGRNSSIEEDKENFIDRPSTPIAAAASAHDRLSQVLDMYDDPALTPRARGHDAVNSNIHSHSFSQDDRLDAMPRSSQIMVVKDSQRSPDDRDDDDAENHGEQERWNPNQFRSFESKPGVDVDANPGKIMHSPTKTHHILFSPPPESHGSRVLFRLDDNNTVARARSNSTSSGGSSTNLRRHSSAQESNATQSSTSAVRRPLEFGGKISRLEPGEKASPNSPRVAETPAAPYPGGSADVVPATSIPETSPNRSPHQSWANDMNNDAMDQEDDDLPPVCLATQERVRQSQPLNLASSSPTKGLFQSKIFSSPSGRQRRALTEIASDASPHVEPSRYEIDVNILSTDDREFKAAVEVSPTPPKKRRRGNDGQGIFASDPILPLPPRRTAFVPPPAVVEQQPDETDPMKQAQPTEPVAVPERVFGRHSNSKRADSMWEIDDESPQFHVSRRERIKHFARPSNSLKQHPPAEPRRERTKEVQPAVEVQSPPPPAPVHVQEPRSEVTASEVPTEEEKETPGVITEAPPRAETPSYKGESSSVDNSPIALNQVFASWSGPKRAYYPATCFGKPFGASQSRYVVKFEDSAPIDVPVGAVKKLELRIGDAVKVDMPNFPKVTHIIRGLDDKLSAADIMGHSSNGVIPMTDVYGHSTLLLGPKQRKSLPNGGLPGPENVVKVPISRIYLDTILWNQLKGRAYTYSAPPKPSDLGVQTPSDRNTMPTSPSTRMSRSIRYSNGLFTGMVFAVSYGENANTKSRIVKMILQNDGRILNEGFNELFDLPSNAPIVTPTKSPASVMSGKHSEFRLSSDAEDIGFACLIADKHSRRPKYMQALALNIPCLSDRWVEDCVAQNRVLDWEMYLLPAGESSYLNGATKSRILAPYQATEARLPETVASRPNFLAGQSVLVVMSRGKADEERRKAYIFLTYALGASRVERLPDVKAVQVACEQGASTGTGWDWVYVDHEEKASAIAAMLGTSAPGLQRSQSSQRSRKRKRTTEKMESFTSTSDAGLVSNVKIMSNELVCQSLILGKLVDQ